MGGLLDRSPDSVTFADLFGSDQEAQAEYAKGLIGLGSFFLSWVVVWFLVLLALRFKRDAGCASGRAFFQTIIEEDSDQIEDTCSLYEGDEDSNRTDTAFSTTKSNNEQEEQYPSNPNESSVPETLSATLATVHVYPSPVLLVVQDEDSNAKEEEQEETASDARSSTLERNRIRQKRTRIVYLLFSLLSCICCCLLLRLTYKPIQDAVANTGDVVTQGRYIVDQIELELQNIKAAADGAIQVIANDLPLDFNELCPEIPPEELQDKLGVDPQQVVRFLKDDFDTFAKFAMDNITAVEDVLINVDRGLVDAQSGVDTLEENIWWLPFVVVATLLLTMLFAVAVVLAWTERVTPHMEKGLLWIGLPMFIVLTITCWAMVIATCFGTVVTSDICTAGPAPGSPEYTMQAILQEQDINLNSTTFKLVTAYTGVSTVLY
jgi:hypothetical protein